MKTILSFVVDIGLVAALIFYFSTTKNCNDFWLGAARLFSSAANYVGSRVPEKPKTPDLASQTAPTLSSRPESEPPPPLIEPPPPPLGPGDCIPPEAQAQEPAPPVANILFQPPPLPKEKKTRTGKGKPVKFEKKKVNGVPLYLTTVDLEDPDTFLVIRLPNKAEKANSQEYSAGHEPFESFVKRYHGAVLVNGTFFSKDEQERVMGNMVTEGKMLKYSPWENYGTTLYLREGDIPEMVTTRAEGKPDYSEHWLSITCGPRLVKNGDIWLNPELEGFRDSHVLGCGPRAAIGFNRDRNKILIATFLRGLSLPEEAKLMKALGCHEAMNLDGGASKGLSHNSEIVMKPGRGLTNVLVVYDTKNKAPKEVVSAWNQFQENPHLDPES